MIRLFAHRGFAKGNILQNSIASLNQAHKNGFKAIEFDIWFLEEKLFLHHDFPKKNALKNLPLLGDYFAYKNDFFYWLDFKNLDQKNVAKVLKMVKSEIDKSGISLDKIYFAPFITDYKIAKKVFVEIRNIFGQEAQIIAVCEKLENAFDIKNLRDFLTKNDIKFLSIFHELVDRTFVKIFPEIAIFAWTVNEKERVKELEKLGVENFATDLIVPKEIK